MTELGYISSCIAHDYRYSSTVKVYRDDDQAIIIKRFENGAISGMDGSDKSCKFRLVYTKTIPRNHVKASIVAREVKNAFDDTIRCYGKPSKNFMWNTLNGPIYGISIMNVKMALER